MTTVNRPKTRRPTHKQLERELVERCDQWGYPLNGQEPWSVPYGFADAEVGTEDWAYWRHLELRNKTPLRYGGDNFELEQLGQRFAKQFHDALDLGFWKLIKAPNGERWKCFEDYLKFESPWGLGVGDNWDEVLKPLLNRIDPSMEAWQRAIKTEGDYVGIVDRIAADRLQDGRSEREHAQMEHSPNPAEPRGTVSLIGQPKRGSNESGHSTERLRSFVSCSLRGTCPWSWRHGSGRMSP